MNAGPTLTRSVVEIHTYELLGGINDWVDSRSQSITMNDAATRRADTGAPIAHWGQDLWQNCRINGPGGNVGCSVPNTVRVSFYGPRVSAPNYNSFETAVFEVSWRDDRGVKHAPVLLEPTLLSPPWNA